MKSKFLSALLLCFVIAFNSCNQNPGAENQTTPALSKEQVNKQAYLEIVKAFETGVTDSLGKYVAENTVSHNEPMPGVTSTGLQQMKDVIALYRKSFTNIKMQYYHVIAEGDMLYAHGSWSGNNTGEYMGMPATNKAVSNVEFVDILRYENGKAAEHWAVGDWIKMMAQMGYLPQMDSLPSAAQPSYDWNATVTSDSAKIAKMKAGYATVLNMIQSGDLSALDQYIAPDFTEHIQVPGQTFAQGVEGAKQSMTMFKQAYPDLKMTVERVNAEGDVLFAYVWVEGTFAGGFGLPPSSVGKHVKFAAVDILKFNAEGKATDHWEVGDHYGEMIQLGVIPVQGANASAAK